jgi:hypothetical protein
MMPENRSTPRRSAKQEGRAILSNRSDLDCTIRDVSATGARLSFRTPTFLPRTFRLAFGSEEKRVTVVWQAGMFAGVRFQSPLASQMPKKRRALFWLSR